MVMQAAADKRHPGVRRIRVPDLAPTSLEAWGSLNLSGAFIFPTVKWKSNSPLSKGVEKIS